MKSLTAGDLAQFTGSEVFYRHPFSPACFYTEGVRYLADSASAYWLIDAILCSQPWIAALRDAEFQVWVLNVRKDQSARLVCSDGNENVLWAQNIPWTDFPLESVTLWFSNQTLYLPSEH